MEEINQKRRISVSKIILYIFYGLVTIALLFLVLNMNDLGQIGNVISNSKIEYILLALGCLLIYLALYPVTLIILCKAEKVECKKRSIYCIGMTEHFFNGITPFATGGQPFEIYALARKNVKASRSTGILAMNFIIFMLVTNAFAIVSLFFFDRFAKTPDIIAIAIVGFSINFLVICFLIFIASNKKAARAMVKMMLWLGKIKFLSKIVNANVVKFEDYLAQTQDAFKELFKHKLAFFACILLRIVTMLAYYAISFFVLKAININIGIEHLFFTVCASSFAITAVVFLPTPGSSGGIEYAFTVIFQTAFVMSAVESASGMLLWRLLTFYLVLLISFIFYVGLEISFHIEKKKNNQMKEENK